MSTQRLSRLTPLAEVYARVDPVARPIAPRRVDVAAAAGRVLAADVTVPALVPVASIALRDGWAVNSELLADAGPYTPLPVVPAPVWVESGAPLPRGADAVLAPDAVTFTGNRAEALAPATPGADVLGPGADAEAGRTLRHAGERLRALDVAVLRAAGIAHVQVREPRLCIFAANSFVDAVDDTVTPMIARAVEANGARATVERAAPNGPRSITEVLQHEEADAIIVIGGTGAGRRDVSVRTLAEVGRVDIHGMGIRPGESAALGTVGDRLVLMLPGRLDGALAGWLLVGRRLVAGLAGDLAAEPTTNATLARKIVSTIGLAEVVPVGRCAGGVEPLASGYFPLHALARAEGWVFVPPESEGYAAGSRVELRSFP